MRRILKFLYPGILGGLIGWALGFLRFPMVEENGSFWAGFVAALAAVMLLLAIFFVRNNRSLLLTLVGKGPNSDKSKSRRMTMAVVVAGLCVALGGFTGSLSGKENQKALEKQILHKDRAIQKQAELLESVQQEQMAVVMGNVLGKIDEELTLNPDSQLTASTIGRVAALSYSFRPYRSMDGDQLSPMRLSPQRGALLLALAKMPIDSVSFAKIKQEASFASADLQGANLRGADLSGVDLKEANLRDAVLIGANMQAANLERANLWGAKLENADLDSANLRRAEMEWAHLNGATLRGANLNGAYFSNAQLQNAILTGAVIQFAFADASLFVGADLSHADLFGTSLVRANLSRVNLTKANLRVAILEDARMAGADLTHVSCGADILQNMFDWRIEEAAEFHSTFEVVDDTIRPFVSAVFRLERIKR